MLFSQLHQKYYHLPPNTSQSYRPNAKNQGRGVQPLLENEKQLLPRRLDFIVLWPFVFINFIFLYKPQEGRRRALHSCQLFCALARRPRQPHEKHVTRPYAMCVTPFENKVSKTLAWLQAVQMRFHREHCASHQKVSKKLTHNETSCEPEMGKQRLPFCGL